MKPKYSLFNKPKQEHQEPLTKKQIFLGLIYGITATTVLTTAILGSGYLFLRCTNHPYDPFRNQISNTEPNSLEKEVTPSQSLPN